MMSLKKFWEPFALVFNAFRGYGFVFVATTGAGIIAGTLGGIGIGALVPLFAYFSKQNAVSGGKISSLIHWLFDTLSIPPTPFLLIAFIVILFTTKALILFVASYYGEKMATSYEERARRDIFRGLMNARWGYLLGQKTGHLERVIMDDAVYAGQVLSLGGLLILSVTSFVIYLAVAFAISPQTTLLILIPAGFLFFVLRGTFAAIQRLADAVVASEKQAAQHITEHLAGVKTVKALDAEEGATKSAFVEFAAMTAIRMKILVYKLASGSFFEPAGFVLIGFIFVLSYHLPGFDLGAFAATMYLVQKIFGYLQSIQANLQNINRHIPNLKSVVRYRDIVGSSAENQSGAADFSFKNELAFRSVKFQYGKNEPVLREASFSILKGATTAIIGPSGAGKTTVADLLLRLFEPESGSIEIDGARIENIKLSAWRNNVGYVSQDVFLINDSIENNIRFYNERVSRKDAERAAKLANVYDAVMALPEGFETVVGERGVKLSGGQRQRIALARVLARKPEVLILDEATSSLDTESERAIQETLRAIRGSITVIMIAHRLSTVRDADLIVALDKGRVIETGTPEELLKNKQSYFSRMSALASDKES